jgi:proteasome assembly chaperone (PAC2) family protein
VVDGFTVTPVEGLRSPIVIIAFAGWSDTGTVTVDAAQQLIDAFNAERFLTVDPEEYFVFSDTRPLVRIDEDTGARVIEWPDNEAYAARVPDASHDLVIVKGTEPNVRWLTFSERLSEALEPLNPSLVCTLVARPAATPHTRSIPVSGSSADPRLAERFNLGRSMYQGPTGIIGVAHDVLRRQNLPLISLVAGVPHYLNVDENPPATVALLNALRPVLGYQPPLGDLEEECVAFVRRVDEASRDDDQIVTYVKSLEGQFTEPEPSQGEDPSAGELPSADDIIRDFEDLIRGND